MFLSVTAVKNSITVSGRDGALKGEICSNPIVLDLADSGVARELSEGKIPE